MLIWGVIWWCNDVAKTESNEKAYINAHHYDFVNHHVSGPDSPSGRVSAGRGSRTGHAIPKALKILLAAPLLTLTLKG